MPYIHLEQDGLPPEIMDQWKHLALNTGQADPICCAPAWNLAFQKLSHPHDRVFYLASPTSLLLFCEYVTERNEIYLVPLEDSWMFGQPLLGPEAPELLADALEIFAREYAPQWPILALSGVRSDSPEALRLYILYSSIFNFYRHGVTVQCSASLNGGVEGWLSRRSANHRAKLSKAAKKAARAGLVFERRRPQTEDEAAEIYARMIAIEEKSWKGLGHCGMAESPSREFYAGLIRLLALRQEARVIFAIIDGQDAGFIFGSVAGGYYRGQQFSYAAEHSRLSLGNLMQLEKIRWLCEEDVRRYDMGPITGPRMEYKAHWTEENRKMETWILRRKK